MAHKLAITVIFAFGIPIESTHHETKLVLRRTIMIGAFRINGIADISFDGDLTYSIGTNVLWALA